jgi:hypothetical protein
MAATRISLFIIIRKNEDSIGTIQIDSNLQSILRGRRDVGKEDVGKMSKILKIIKRALSSFDVEKKKHV